MKRKLSTISLKILFTFIFISVTFSGLSFREDIYVGNGDTIHIGIDTAYSGVLQSDSDSITITNLQVASGEPYEVVYDGLHEGAPVYIDRDYTITGYPEYLEGTVYIKTANDDKYGVEVEFLSFEVDRDVTVYVAHDPRIVEKPDWLNVFTHTVDEMVTSDTIFSIYSKKFSAGVVNLGGNAGHHASSMYIVIVVPQPEIYSVEPNRGRNNSPTNITIYGHNFEPTPRVALYGGGPDIVGSAKTPGDDTGGVYVSNNYAYVADGDSGLQVIEISNPTNPTIVGTADTPGSAKGVYVSNSYAYVADGSSGLQVIEISNPTNPTIVGSADTPGDANGVYVSGNYAYVADGSSGLQVIDITDPTNPTTVGSADTPGSAKGVYVSNSYAYVADWVSGLQVANISNPENPTIVGSADTGEANNVHVLGNYAYVACGHTDHPVNEQWGVVRIVDISDHSNPLIVGSVSPGDLDARDVYIRDNFAYVPFGFYEAFGYLRVFDISDPTNPTLVSQIDTAAGVKSVYVLGNYAYVTDAWSHEGLYVIDIANLRNPTIVGSVDTPGSANGVYFTNNYAYVADGDSGIQIIDITDPTNTTITGSADTPGDAKSVYVSNNYAYVADGDSGLQIIDISDPKYPTNIGSVDTPGLAMDVYLSGNYAYVADGYGISGFQVIDITNPEFPSIIGSVNTPNWASGVYVSGDYAYVADDPTGLQIIDITDSTTPIIVGSAGTSGEAGGVFVSGNYAYVADGSSGLQVIEISNPTNPTIVGSVDTPNRAGRVYVLENYAYVADGWYWAGGDLQVIDVSDPTYPTIVGSADTPGDAKAVYVLENHAYVADGAGLQVLRSFEPCTDIAFVDSTTLTATVPAGLPVGTLNLHVVNPNGEGATLQNAYLVSATNCNGDYDLDYDVDGSDLSALIKDLNSIDLETFAIEFGRNNCF